MFAKVTESTLEKMSNDQLVFHYHNWAITKETFYSSKSLTSFFNVIATDDGHHQDIPNNEGKIFDKFITIIEAKNYPIFGALFHPEY